MNIFVIEDEPKIKEELKILLSSYGYTCELCCDYKNVINEVKSSKADLILLDINLPYFDGFHICREIRKTSDVPIIIVTSRDSDIDELMGLSLGADDFISKPYNKQILLAHILAVLKRYEFRGKNEQIKYKNVVFEPSKGSVIIEDKEIVLTKNEMKILNVLIRNVGKIVSRDSLMDELWQTDEFVDDNTLTVNVNRLRKKLENAGAINIITTRRGQGYMFE